MRVILEDLSTVPGVNGSFVWDEGGNVVARTLPDLFDDALLTRIGAITSRAVAGLETAGEVGDLDFTFSDGRLIVKNFGSGSLCILCEPDVSASFLTLSAGVAVKKLAQKSANLEPQTTTTLREELRQIIWRELGENSGRAMGILDQTGDDPAELESACAAITRLTRLFISRKKSEEIDILLQGALVRP